MPLKVYITYSQREIDPSQMKEIGFTCSLTSDKLNTRTLLLVLECLKYRAFNIRTVYILALGPTWTRLTPMGECGGWGNPTFVIKASRMVRWFVYKGLCGRINYLKRSCFLHYPLTVWHHIFTGCSHGGKLFGNILCIPLSLDEVHACMLRSMGLFLAKAYFSIPFECGAYINHVRVIFFHLQTVHAIWTRN